METTEKNPTYSRKWVRVTVLLLLLVVLPALSYYYLDLGYKKHKETQDELRHYGQVRKESFVYPDGTEENRLAGKVCLIYYFGENPELTEINRRVLDTGEELFNQFSDGGRRDDIRLVMIAQGGSAEFRSYAQTKPSADFITWVWSRALGSWRVILDRAREQFKRDEDVDTDVPCFALADSDGVIRRFYPVDDPGEINKMSNHLATLLPKH